MKSCIVLLAILAGALLLESDATNIISGVLEKWIAHKEEYKLDFNSDEDAMRYEIFEKNLAFIENHNQKNTDLVLGMNQFTHWTHDEYKEFLRQGFYDKLIREPRPRPTKRSKDLPDVDWRKQGLVSQIKDQKQCGSCWAFSATGSLEGQYAKIKKNMVELSEQDLVDCSSKYGNEGCDGGLMDNAFKYVKDMGINSEKDYPYTGEDGKCKHKNSTSVLKVSSFVDVPSGDEQALQKAIAKIGPVSVAIDASGLEFQFYKSGVYTSNSCSSLELDHGVLAVGFGSQPQKHYIIKNSWGTSWGEKGYMLMARDHDNMCGIATAASYPKVVV